MWISGLASQAHTFIRTSIRMDCEQQPTEMQELMANSCGDPDLLIGQSKNVFKKRYVFRCIDPDGFQRDKGAILWEIIQKARLDKEGLLLLDSCDDEPWV